MEAIAITVRGEREGADQPLPLGWDELSANRAAGDDKRSAAASPAIRPSSHGTSRRSLPQMRAGSRAYSRRGAELPMRAGAPRRREPLTAGALSRGAPPIIDGPVPQPLRTYLGPPSWAGRPWMGGGHRLRCRLVWGPWAAHCGAIEPRGHAPYGGRVDGGAPAVHGTRSGTAPRSGSTSTPTRSSRRSPTTCCTTATSNAALRRMMQQGFRDRNGEQVQGMRDMREPAPAARPARALRPRRRLRRDRRGAARGARHGAPGPRRPGPGGARERRRRRQEITDQVVAERNLQLDMLPPDLAGMVQELQQYEFTSSEARRSSTS